jgi:hypothetical protein
MIEICFPWEVKEKFRSNQMSFQNVTQNLFKRGYRLKSLEKEPSEVVIKATEDIIQKLSALQEAGEVPWLFVVCNNRGLIHKLSRFVPVTWSLSTRSSCYTIDNQYLIDKVYRLNRGEFYTDEEDDLSEMISRSNLLFWRGVSEVVPGLQKFVGRTMHILDERYERPTVFTHAYSKSSFAPEDMDEVYTEVRSCLGGTVSHVIEENSTVQNYKLTKESIGRYGEAEL